MDGPSQFVGPEPMVGALLGVHTFTLSPSTS